MKRTIIIASALAMAASFAGMAHAEKPDHKQGGQPAHGFQRMDTNRDGAVSRAEFEAHSKAMAFEMFKKMDTNGDGVLTKADRGGGHHWRNSGDRKGTEYKDGLRDCIGGDHKCYDSKNPPWERNGHDRDRN